jgi:TolB-like protein/Flp pilus assembly protein TadD
MNIRVRQKPYLKLCRTINLNIGEHTLNTDPSRKPQRLRIFLSHSSNDRPVVSEIYKRLLSDGYKPWIDKEDLLGGQEWEQEIVKAVRDSDIVIICLSRNSVNKRGYVQREIKFALDRVDEQPQGVIFLIPLRLDECDVPQRLSRWQWVDYFAEGGYEQLVKSLLHRASTPESEQLQSADNTPSVDNIPPDDNTRSIAVLPFDNLSADAESNYFCDELAGELINKLTKAEGLKVTPRTSSFTFRDKGIGIKEIGQHLNVDYIMDGQVITTADYLRISARLVRVVDDYCLWSAQYDRKTRDIFQILNEITLEVVDALKLTLLREEKDAILKRHTNNPEAYETYLRGRYSFYKHTEEGWLESIEYFKQAIEKDPEYALAYARLSSVLAFAWYFGVLRPWETIVVWEAANNQALKIGNNLEETHIAAGRFYFFYKWDWPSTEREYKRAIELNPQSADAHQQYGLFLASRGRFEQAIDAAELAIKFEPHSLLVNYHVGWIYWLANRLDEVLKTVWQMIRIEPNFYGAYAQRGTVYLAMEKYEEAIKEYQRAMKLNFDQQILGGLGYAYGMAGKRVEALDVIKQLIDAKNRYSANEVNIARAYAGLGDYDKTFEWLEQAYQKRNGNLVYLKVHAEMKVGIWGKGFSTDRRLPDLLRRIGITS